MYKVYLAACGNIDYDENPYEHEVNGELVATKWAEYETIEQCQEVVRKYIEKNDLGGGNWDGGYVFENDVQIGYISYNGRYWEKDHEYYQDYATRMVKEK